MTPFEYRRGGSNSAIRFAVGECSLGSILVAASVKAVRAIFLGDDPDRLTRDLQERFPRADLIGGDRDFERIVAVVVGIVETPATGLNLPLDVRGTAFVRTCRKFETSTLVRLYVPLDFDLTEFISARKATAHERTVYEEGNF